MAGVLAATMRTPIAAMAMVMEMTGSFGLIVPLMLCTMTAYVVGGRFGVVAAQTESAADSPAHAGDALVSLLERQRVADVMDRRWPYTARPATPIGALLRDLRPGVHPTVPVLDGDRLAGVLSMDELQFVLDEPELGGALIAADVMNSHTALLLPSDSLYDAMHQFEAQGAEALAVVSRPANGSYLGMLSRSAVFDRVRNHMDSLQQGFRREHAALVESREVTHLLGALSATDQRSLDHVPVAHDWVGRSLRELDFRRAFGSEVLAVQTATRAVLHPPDPNRPLEAGDVLLVVRSDPPQNS
jgi:CBS domain-containing protein